MDNGQWTMDNLRYPFGMEIHHNCQLYIVHFQLIYQIRTSGSSSMPEFALTRAWTWAINSNTSAPVA